MKYCSRCTDTLPLKDFGKDASKSDGLTLNCKACRKQYFATYYQKNREKVNAANRARYQLDKSAGKVRDETWQKKNPEKARDKNRRWREANSDRAKEISRSGSHRRRARIAGGNVEKYTEADVLEAYGTNCHLCGIAIDLNAPRRSGDLGWEMSLHIDHFLEISLGGDDTLANVRPSHGVCNIRKRRSVKS